MKAKKILKNIAAVLVLGFVVVQFYRPERTNPPIVEAETLEANAQVPENVAAILKRSCNDCHTNQTNYPLYSNISPFSWMLMNHINEGRRQLNFSAWGTYDAKRRKRKLDQTCDEVTSGTMPHNQYLWLHRDARLSDEDKKILCDWTDAEKAKLENAK